MPAGIPGETFCRNAATCNNDFAIGSGENLSTQDAETRAGLSNASSRAQVHATRLVNTAAMGWYITSPSTLVMEGQLSACATLATALEP
eukprot:5116521-Amphidinium_carterae.1